MSVRGVQASREAGCRKEISMKEFKRGYALKAAGALLVMVVIAGALLFGPVLRPAPEVGPPVQVPAMTNIPPEGSLQIETVAPSE